MIIFIPINQGFAFRYIIQSNIFIELQKKAEKIIFLVPHPDDSFYKDLKEYKNVILEDYKQDQCETYLHKSRLHGWLRLIRSFVQNGRFNIDTTKDLYEAFVLDYKKKYKSSLYRKIFLSVTNLIIHFARRSKTIRRIILGLESQLYTPSIHTDIFKKYNPDVLVVTSLGTFLYDQLFMRQARKKGVKVVTVVLSWDNTTTRGMPAAKSDRVIAWTEEMKKELITLNDISGKKIKIGGVAHYDYYYNYKHLYSKEKLFEILKLDINKKLIFLVTKSPNGYASNAHIAKLILEGINKGELTEKCQLLVRLHPIYYRRKNSQLIFQNFLNEILFLKQSYRNLVINEPIIESSSLNYSMPANEIKLLASILWHSSLVINMFSTINIEASIFNVPIVNVCFDSEIPAEINKARYNIKMDMNQTHNQRIVESGGVAMVYSAEDLIPIIKEELINPEKREKERRHIMEQEAGPNGGNAGYNIAQLIIGV